MSHVATLSRLSAARNRDEPDERNPLARPDRPGRWTLRLPDGRVLRGRVIERNGKLYLIRGGCFAVAQPVDHFDGAWLADD